MWGKMIKILRVGDPHVTISNLKESQDLIDFIIKTAIKNEVVIIEFLGDLFHTHSVMRMEVVDFWSKNFHRMCNSGLKVVALSGNHDKTGSKEKEQTMSALDVFKNYRTKQDDLRIISKYGEKDIFSMPIGHIPYTSDESLFIEIANDPKLQIENMVAKLFTKGLLRTRNKNRDVYFNIQGNKRRMFTVPLNEHPNKATVAYFKTNEGLEAYELLNKLLEEEK